MDRFLITPRLWNHASVSVPRKCQTFHSIITSRLLYGLSSTWLNAADRHRLNGFQAECLRRVLRIQPSFVSRISNQTVLERSGQAAYDLQLLKQQLLLFGKVARCSNTDVLRNMAFRPGCLLPATDAFVRRVGRPRAEWAKMILPIASRIARTDEHLDDLISNGIVWRSRVVAFINS